MSIACNELQQTINSLLIAFKDCNKIKNSDLRKLVDLSVSLYACSNGGSGETGDIQHNATENIQGGSLFERFHLTQEQYDNLEFLTNKVDSLDDEGYTEGDDFISFYTTVKAVNDGLNLKVDKVTGKSLVLDTEIAKLVNLDNTKDINKPVSIPQESRIQEVVDAQITDSIALTNPTIPIVPTGNVHILGVGPGTYSNWGNQTVPANNIATLRRVSGVFSMSLTPIPIPSVNTEAWTNVAGYASGVDRTHLGKLWKSNAATATTDIPGTSSKWVEILSAYGETIEKTEDVFNVYKDKYYLVDEAGNIGFMVNNDGAFSKNINENASEIVALNDSITILEQGVAGYGDTCKIQENKGIYIFPTTATVTGINAILNTNRSIKKWGQKSYEFSFSNSDTINIGFGQTVSSATNIGLWWYLPYKYNQGNIASITFSLTLAGTVVGTSIVDYIQYNQQSTGWNLEKWLLTEFGNPTSFDGLRIAVAVDVAAVNIGNYKAGFFIDSVVINQRLQPSLAISYDSVWLESYTNGVFQFHKDNKIPFNITDKEINQSTSTDAYYVYMQKLVKDNLACVAVYSQAMKDNTYPTYATKRDYIKPFFDSANNLASKKVITACCAQNIYNEMMLNAFKELGVNVVRGSGNTKVNYIEDFFQFGSVGYANLNTDTRAIEDSKIAQAKAYIDKLISLGSFGCIITHGVMSLESITEPYLHNSVYVWFEILNYIKTKSDAGLLNVVKFDDIYYSANGKFNS